MKKSIAGGRNYGRQSRKICIYCLGCGSYKSRSGDAKLGANLLQWPGGKKQSDRSCSL